MHRQLHLLEAIFEDDDQSISNRLEGAGVKIKLETPIVFFNERYDQLHPDVLGLVCLAIFYPFIGRKVTLPSPVSTRLPEALSRQIFTKTKQIEITNVDPTIPAYKGNGSAVLAYGGGMDSTAVRALFPEAYVVHEASVREGGLVEDHTNAVVQALEVKQQGKLVKTNSRYLSRPGGWHIWIGSMVTALLEANKRNASYIYAGTILGSAFMSNGVKYFDRHAARSWHGESGNYWQQLFWDIGLPMVQPLMGCSEILTMRASLGSFAEDEIFFCTADHGRPCGVCPKCFRRNCIKAFNTGIDVDMTAYDNSSVHALLSRRPTYFGHIYAALMSQGWTPPIFLKQYFEHLPKDNTFALHHNSESIDFMPAKLMSSIKDVLENSFSQMTEAEIRQMKNWDQSKS